MTLTELKEYIEELIEEYGGDTNIVDSISLYETIATMEIERGNEAV